MIFPAYDSFRRDPTRTLAGVKVYECLVETLDFRDVRDVKAWALASASGIHRCALPAVLTALVRGGYLHEYRRGCRGIRRFALAWSIGERKPPIGRKP